MRKAARWGEWPGSQEISHNTEGIRKRENSLNLMEARFLSEMRNTTREKLV